MDAAALMRAADRNRDGSVDLNEMTVWWKNAGPRLLLASAANAKSPPTSQQLRRLAVISAVPCIAFGCLDNSVMLLAGDAIDTAIGVKFGLSALACAAVGNVVADSIGQLSGGSIGALLKPHLPNPKLTPSQQASSQVRTTHLVASTLGIVLGCLIGCFPLLWMSNEKTPNEKPVYKPKHQPQTKVTFPPISD